MDTSVYDYRDTHMPMLFPYHLCDVFSGLIICFEIYTIYNLGLLTDSQHTHRAGSI
jgi:hypothetical protein